MELCHIQGLVRKAQISLSICNLAEVYARCHTHWAGSGPVVQRWCVSYITGASNWYWLKLGRACYPCSRLGSRGNVFISSVSSLSFLFLFLPCPSLSFLLLSLLSLFSLSLGDDTKWPTRVDVSLKSTQSIKQYTLNYVLMLCKWTTKTLICQTFVIMQVIFSATV